MKVSDLLFSIRNCELVVPEFQREYVWNRIKARELLVSLVKDYPIGSLLFWKTDAPPKLKSAKNIPKRSGPVQIILDGQQRLTALYLLIENSIPPYYNENDIQKDPRQLYYNLETAEFQYYLRSRMKNDPLWVHVPSCFNPDVQTDVFKIASDIAGEGNQEAFNLAKKYQRNLDNLQNIKNKSIPVQMVPAEANITGAIDIFDRVNSLGTKLTDAELALTHVTGNWSKARVKMKSKLDELGECNFCFDLTFMVRALTVIVARRALYEMIHGYTYEELIEGWKRLSKLLDYLVTILPGKAYINSTEDLATPNVLVPLLLYLDCNKGRFPSDKAMKEALHWLYAAQMWARYTGQTDQRLEHDVSIVKQETSPWSKLLNQIIDQRGRIEVKAADLEGRWANHPLYRMATVVAKSHGAVDWFNGAPLAKGLGKRYQLHSHHIFSQDLLYKNRYDSDNHLHRKIVNEIANRAFLTADTNLKLGNTPPEEYLPKVEQQYPGALVKQFIPMKPELWKVGRFNDFLAARRELIAIKINELMNSLVTEPEKYVERSADDLRTLGESATLEFKSTLRWDVVQQCVNKDLQFSVLKTIVAFLNSGGGTLIIGVEDNGSVFGLDNDLRTLKKNTLDVFQQTLVNLIVKNIGVEFSSSAKIRFETVENSNVCIVDVDPAVKPAYLKTGKGTQFYIRAGNTSRSLDPEETMSYIQSNMQ